MNSIYQEYTIFEKNNTTQDAYTFCLKPKNGKVLSFKSGQYCFLKNPLDRSPDEPHPFSIASSSQNHEYLEFCIKKMGDWTSFLCDNSNRGDTILVSEPQGQFIWDNTILHAVFLSGGIGISPFMAMLRSIADKKNTPDIKLLYGNRTQETIAYKKDLEELEKKIHSLSIVHVFSNLEENDSWKGYRGFITRDILEKEVDLTKNPVFFLIGPPAFIDSMKQTLSQMKVKKENCIEEVLEGK